MTQVAGRDVVVLGVSAVVVVVATAMGSRLGRGKSSDATAISTALVPPPLPSGAELRTEPPLENVEGGCNFLDHGFGDYERWRSLRVGRVLVPSGRGLDDTASFNLLVHFHGSEPVRKQLAPEGLDLVIAALDAGTRSSHYDHTM